MMKYNFDERVDSLERGTLKWGKVEELFGSKDILPLWVAEMDFKLPDEVINKLKEKAEDGMYGYTVPPESLFKSVVNWLHNMHDWKVDKEAILHTTGVMPTINAAIQTFTEKGDAIIIQPPVYAPFSKVIQTLERKVVTNPLIREDEKYKMDFADLKAKIVDANAKMLLLCSPHNPVGRVWSIDELTQLAEICIEHDVIIVSDEIHYDLVFNGVKHTPLLKVKEELEERAIVTVSTSKTFNLAGLKTAFAIVPNEQLRNKLKETLGIMYQSMANPFSVTAVEAVYEFGKEWLEQCVDYVEGNKRFLDEFIKERIPEIKVIKSEGTYLAWLDCRKLGMDGDELYQFMLRDAKVALNNGRDFGKEGDGFLRMNIACQRSTLQEALVRIEKAMKARK